MSLEGTTLLVNNIIEVPNGLKMTKKCIYRTDIGPVSRTEWRTANEWTPHSAEICLWLMRTMGFSQLLMRITWHWISILSHSILTFHLRAILVTIKAFILHCHQHVRIWSKQRSWSLLFPRHWEEEEQNNLDDDAKVDEDDLSTILHHCGTCRNCPCVEKYDWRPLPYIAQPKRTVNYRKGSGGYRCRWYYTVESQFEVILYF